MVSKGKRGITLISLVVTIIVLLILAGISVATLTGDNGLIANAGKAKEQAEIDGEKEIVETSTIQAMGKNKYGDVIQNDLEEKLNSNAGDGKTEVIDNGDTLVVKFIDSERYYEVDSDGNVEYYEVIVDEHPGNIKVGINGEELKGTEESPFQIWCIEDLVEWSQNYAEYKNSYIKLERTLDFNSNLSYTDGKVLSCSSINELKDLLTNTSGSGFTPIADFRGNFDGKSFEIRNIYINVTGNAGLFAESCGIIQNLGITGNIISSESNAGGIVGCTNNTLTINNCHNLANVTAKTYAGGIVGYQYVQTRLYINCYNVGKIQGEIAGGILGKTTSGQAYIYNCYNIGDISGSTAGGIMGYKYHNTTTEIKNCYNFSNISGDTYNGEIIGRNWAYDSSSSATIENTFYTNEGVGAFGGFQNSNGTPIYFGSNFDENFVLKLNDYIKTISNQEINWNNWILGSKGYPIFE